MAIRNGTSIVRRIRQPGFLAGMPALLFLLIGFIGPFAMILAYSFMPPGTFGLLQAPTLENYVSAVTESYYLSLLWSVMLAATTVVITLIVCYPMAYGMAKVFGKWSKLITVLVVIPILISENIRLFGWVLVFVKNGILDGTLQYLFDFSASGLLYTVPATLLGLVYVYLPFMLFPLVMGISMVPESLKEAASDLGASRLEILREVELPLSTPGIMIGCILTFILALGSLIESKMLGGQTTPMIASTIEDVFTYGQNWPGGSALAVLLLILSGLLVLFLFQRIDLDRIIGNR